MNFRIFCKGSLLDFTYSVGWVWVGYLTSAPPEIIKRFMITWWFQWWNRAKLVCLNSFDIRHQIWQRFVKPCCFLFSSFLWYYLVKQFLTTCKPTLDKEKWIINKIFSFEKISLLACCIFILIFCFIFIPIHWSFKLFAKTF